MWENFYAKDFVLLPPIQEPQIHQKVQFWIFNTRNINHVTLHLIMGEIYTKFEVTERTQLCIQKNKGGQIHKAPLNFIECRE